MIVETFRTYHLQLLIAQGVQSSQIQQVSHVPATYASVERPPGLSMTVRDGEHILLCGGVIPTGPTHGTLWAALSADAGHRMLWLHRATRRFLDIETRRRIEATVEDGFPAGCRWLDLLGFEFEGRMRGYGDNGETHLRYARIR
jgi:hypothetical protein